MTLTVVPIVLSELGTILKGLVRKLEELQIGRRVETIRNVALLRSTIIVRRVLETRGKLTVIQAPGKDH